TMRVERHMVKSSISALLPPRGDEPVLEGAPGVAKEPAMQAVGGGAVAAGAVVLGAAGHIMAAPVLEDLVEVRARETLEDPPAGPREEQRDLEVDERGRPVRADDHVVALAQVEVDQPARVEGA